MPPIQIALLLVSVLPQLIANVETLFAHKPSSGSEKKDAVLSTLSTGIDVAHQLGVKELGQSGVKEQFVALASHLTDAVVAGFNAAGAFRHHGPAA